MGQTKKQNRTKHFLFAAHGLSVVGILAEEKAVS